MALAGGVFISWGSPDAAAVAPIVARLRGLGIGVWEYSEDMPAGAQIHDKIMDVINDVRVVVVCFSDATADREWIGREVAWAVQAQRRNQSVQRILPVWVGPHPENKIPSLIQERALSVLDASSQDEAAYKRLIDEVVAQLGSEAPIIIPGALYAMNAQQAGDVFKEWVSHGAPPAFHAMFTAFGMGVPPPLYELLAQRYGATREELRPFRNSETMVDLLVSVVNAVNGRQPQNKAPFYIRWVHSMLAQPVGSTARKEARDQWLAGDSLLVVDSISALHPQVKAELLSVPELQRTAILWLPPYTQQVATVEGEFETAVDVALDRLGDIFRQLEQQPQRAMTFDVGTPLALRLWLQRTVAGFSNEAVPFIDVVQSIPGTRRSLNRILTAAGG
jgi:hypothetical protein